MSDSPLPPLAPQASPLSLRSMLRIIVPALLIFAAIITFIGQYTDIDFWFADFYFDPVKKVFRWDNVWFFRDFMHVWFKRGIVVFGVLLTGFVLIDFFLRFKMIGTLRRMQLRVLTLSALIEPWVIKTLKDSSNMHCPFGIVRYNGEEPYMRLLDWVPSGWHAGQCFPAGHASGGMWLMAIAVLWLPFSPRKAFVAFCCGSSVGLIMGWVQQMRGQHFLTHTLWTFWISSVILFCLIMLFSKHLLVADKR